MRKIVCMILVCLLVLGSLPLIGLTTGNSSSEVPERGPVWTYSSVESVESVAISAEGENIAISTADEYIISFTPYSNTPKGTIDLDVTLDVLEMNDDGTHVFGGSGREVYAFNVTEDGGLEKWWSEEVLEDYDDHTLQEISISSQGEYLAVAGYSDDSWRDRTHELILIDKEGNDIWRDTRDENEDGYPGFKVDITSDGSYVVAGVDDDSGNIQLRDNTDSTPIIDYATNSRVKDVSISEYGEFFVGGSDQVYYFEKDTSTPLWTRDFDSEIDRVSISPDGQNVTAVVEDKIYNFNETEIFWELEVRLSVQHFSPSPMKNHIGFSSPEFLRGKIGDSIENYRKDDLDSFRPNDIDISEGAKYSVVADGTELRTYHKNKEPNLQPVTLIFSEENPEMGERITVETEVENIGNLESVPSSVRFYLNGELQRSEELPSLEPDESTTIGTEIRVIEGGNHSIEAKVNPLRNAYESSYTNNNITESLVVSSIEKPEESPWKLENPVGSNIEEVSFDDTGKYITASGDNDYIHFFNRNLTLPIWSEETTGTIDSLIHSPLSNHSIYGIGRELYYHPDYSDQPLWSEEVLEDYDDHTLQEISISSQGEYLAVAGYSDDSWRDRTHELILIDKEGNDIWRDTRDENEDGYPGFKVDITSDGSYVVAGVDDDSGNIQLRDNTDSTPIIDFATNSRVKDVSISEYGEFFVGGSDQVYYFDKNIDTPIWSRDIGGDIDYLEIDESGENIAAVSGSTLAYLDGTANGEELWSYEAESDITDMKLSDNGEYLVISYDDKVLAFSITEVEEKDLLWTYNTGDHVESLDISANGKNAIAASGEEVYYFHELESTSLRTPSPPEGLDSTIGDGYVTLTWTSRIGEEGFEIDGYNIYRGDSEDETELIDSVDPTVGYYNDTGLVNGKAYYYQLTAEHTGLESDKNKTTIWATPATLPTPPRNLEGEGGEGYIDLDWESPEDDGGVDITEYHIYRDEEHIDSVDGDTTTYKDEDLEAGETYDYTVTAENDKGESDHSDLISITVLEQYELNVYIEGEGEVQLNPNRYLYWEGTEVTLEPIPKEGWAFEEWTGDVESTSHEIEIMMNENKEVTAVFYEPEELYELSIRIEGEGTVDVNGEEVEDDWTDEFYEGEELTLNAIADEKWVFEEWTGDIEDYADEIEIVMDEDKEITAVFYEPEEWYELSIGVEGEGTVGVNGEEVEDGWTSEFGEGQRLTLEAIADENWEFEEWTGDREGTEEEVAITIDGDMDITANFAEEEGGFSLPILPISILVIIIIVGILLYLNRSSISSFMKKSRKSPSSGGSTQSMMDCPNCGAENPDDSNYCQSCGEQLDPGTKQWSGDTEIWD